MRLIVLLSCAVLFAGWRALWFLTDDAFIAFRYVSNSVLGYGYVWNPPPFAPVEGYTSFLWVVLLDAIWRVTGIAPPEASNVVSLAFAIASLLLTARLVANWPLGPTLSGHRLALTALLLGGIVTNRTFLTWTSSGLETQMSNFWGLAWLASACAYSRDRTRSNALRLSTFATLLALTRPEGLLFAGATAAIVAVEWVGRRDTPGAVRNMLWSLAPLFGIAAHLAWRRSFYGEWLPNTYYAKHVAPWPEAGAHYLLQFVLEHSLWFCAALSLAFLPSLIVRRWRDLRAAASDAGWLVGWIERGLIRDLAVAATVASVLYYTLVIGGDTFGFRIYSHLVPLIALALLWLVDRAGMKPSPAIAVLAAHGLLASPIAWTHYVVARELPAQVKRQDVAAQIAPDLPTGLRWYGELYDRTSAWLKARLLCGRHHGWEQMTRDQMRKYPARDEQQRLPEDDIPVLALEAVGYAGWSLPYVAILDVHGLNDYVVARMPARSGVERQMAHDRVASPEYLAEFEPNVRVHKSEPRVRYSARANGPLTAERVREIERRWRERVRAAPKQ